MNTLNVLILAGDGIGPEVSTEAIAILSRVCEAAGITLNLEYAAFGGAAIDQEGAPVSQQTLALGKQANAVFLGAVGGPKWDNLPTDERPEKGLLGMREHLEVFANLRPARLFPALADASPLKEERSKNFDFLVVRELVGGIYFGKPRGISSSEGQRVGINSMVYSEPEINRIGRVAFDIATRRKKQLVSVDKANVLEVMALWQSVMTDLSREYPDVVLSHLYVDNAAMQMILRPADFDVIVTGNMFGDILSDLAAAATGSIGLLPSASIGEKCALYEPVHGSAPDIAGQGKANPLAAIMSMAMLLEHSAKRPDLSSAVNKAVEATLEAGYRTPDLASAGPTRQVGTQQMAKAVLQELNRLL